MAYSSPFVVMTNIFVPELSETFRKNSNMFDLFSLVGQKYFFSCTISEMAFAVYFMPYFIFTEFIIKTETHNTSNYRGVMISVRQTAVADSGRLRGPCKNKS